MATVGRRPTPDVRQQTHVRQVQARAPQVELKALVKVALDAAKQRFEEGETAYVSDGEVRALSEFIGNVPTVSDGGLAETFEDFVASPQVLPRYKW